MNELFFCEYCTRNQVHLVSSGKDWTQRTRRRSHWRSVDIVDGVGEEGDIVELVVELWLNGTVQLGLSASQ